MKAVRLQNFRVFNDSGWVNIRPLTLLLGANSSGKSSFLKLFPLLKQSMNVDVRGTFLWNGRLVDFKNFKNSVRSGADEMHISFMLHDIDLSSELIFGPNEKIMNCEIELVVSAIDDNWDYLKAFYVRSELCHIDCEIDKNKNVSYLSVGNLNTKITQDKIQAIPSRGGLPRLVFGSLKEGKSSSPYIEQKAQNLLGNIFTSEIDRIYLRYLLSGWAFTKSRNFIEKHLLKEFLARVEISTSVSSELEALSIYYSVNSILQGINKKIRAIASSVTYVAPLRANFERFYRFQNYAVENIDSDGRNLAMFLNSLSQEQLKSINQWFSNVFDFSIKTIPSEGHVEILLQETKNDEFRNLVDLGFGYTEILPILIMIWKSIYMDLPHSMPNNQTYILAIEQPELHLHPRFQAKFAQILARAIQVTKEMNINYNIIIETHSEVIANNIGRMINKKELSENDVNVVLFDAQKEGMEHYVECVQFSKDGYIQRWPYGFFDDDVD